MKDLKSIEQLKECFKKFPTIGDKTAERMAYAVINFSCEDVNELINVLNKVKSSIHPCPICGLLTEDEICSICSSPTRDKSSCIVIANYKDVYPFENSHSFHGVYHCLNGEISPMKGVSPKDLRIKELLMRIEKENIEEIIIATNPTLEGETTALYISELLKDKNVKVSRMGLGIPFGGQLDYMDELTITKALEGKKTLKD